MSTLIYLLLPIIFYSCSGILDAIMDTLKDHFAISIFSKLNPIFWNPAVSWTNKYIDYDSTKGHRTFNFLGIKINTPDAFSDAWHISKFLRQGFNILAILSVMGLSVTLPYIAILFIALSIFRNLAFDIFYNKILRK